MLTIFKCCFYYAYISPVINRANTVNFTVKIHPPQTIVAEENHFDDLLKDIGIEDFLS